MTDIETPDDWRMWAKHAEKIEKQLRDMEAAVLILSGNHFDETLKRAEAAEAALSAERQAREAAEAEARSNQLHAEHEHNEGKRLSLMLKEAEARLKEAGAVKVKPLEWQYDSFQEIWRGWSSIGTYAAWELNGIGIVRMRYGGDGIVVGKTIEDAKAYAQKDFEQCILSALASPPAPHVAEIPEGWRDISTAPKDGTDILVWKKGFRHPEIVRYELYHDADLEEEVGEPGFWRYSDDVLSDIADASEEGFTDWMPLPAAPHHKQEGGNT